MTVHAFAGHVQAAMYVSVDVHHLQAIFLCQYLSRGDAIVHATGINFDRPLFNMSQERGFHAMIPCRTQQDGRIMLCAGTAHGVRKSAQYGVYLTNLQKEAKRTTQLIVSTCDQNDFTSSMILPEKAGVDINLPPFFYAVEEQGYFENLKIFPQTETPEILSGLRGIEMTENLEDANVKLVVDRDNISLIWNGFRDHQKDQRELQRYPDTNPSKKDLQHHILRGARFCTQLLHHEVDLNVGQGLRIRLHKVDFDTNKPTGDNYLKTDRLKSGSVRLELKEGDAPIRYCLTITNNNTYAVWPYVIFYDPQGFQIGEFNLFGSLRMEVFDFVLIQSRGINHMQGFTSPHLLQILNKSSDALRMKNASRWDTAPR